MFMSISRERGRESSKLRDTLALPWQSEPVTAMSAEDSIATFLMGMGSEVERCLFESSVSSISWKLGRCGRGEEPPSSLLLLFLVGGAAVADSWRPNSSLTCRSEQEREQRRSFPEGCGWGAAWVEVS